MVRWKTWWPAGSELKYLSSLLIHKIHGYEHFSLAQAVFWYVQQYHINLLALDVVVVTSTVVLATILIPPTFGLHWNLHFDLSVSGTASPTDEDRFKLSHSFDTAFDEGFILKLFLNWNGERRFRFVECFQNIVKF